MKKILLACSTVFIFHIGKAQLGINTLDPKSTLHMEASQPSTPTGEDGILIPRMSQYPTAPMKKGHLIFLNNHTTDQDGFYYWDGEDWKSLILDSFSRTEEKSVYIGTGTGYSGTGGTAERTVLFNNLTGNDLTGFSIASNSLTVGKKGKYLLSFNSALKKDASTPAYRATYVYRIKVNGATEVSVSSSIPNETESATGVSTSTLLELNSGDVISVTVQKNNESHAHNTYQGYGTNSLVLTYLID